jgi:hypothetical protein
MQMNVGLAGLGAPGVSELHKLLLLSLGKPGEYVQTSWRSPGSKSKLFLYVINHTKTGGQQWFLYSETGGIRELMFDSRSREILVIHGLISIAVSQLQQMGRRNNSRNVNAKVG